MIRKLNNNNFSNFRSNSDSSNNSEIHNDKNNDDRHGKKTSVIKIETVATKMPKSIVTSSLQIMTATAIIIIPRQLVA